MMHLTLIDFKTGRFIAPEARLQLGGYSAATHYQEGGIWQPVPFDCHPTQAVLVQVRPEGTKVVVRMGRAELETAANQFDKCHDLFTYFVGLDAWKIPEQESYRIDGHYYPSVTYILSHIISKPGLLNWYAKMASEGKDPKAERDKRGVQGTSVHKVIGTFLEGRTVDLTQAPDWLTDSVVGFERWAKKVKLNPVWTERKVANEERGFAGTLDCLAWCELEDGNDEST